jgi:hypothetical protein
MIDIASELGTSVRLAGDQPMHRKNSGFDIVPIKLRMMRRKAA